jgi:hypothetical protein
MFPYRVDFEAVSWEVPMPGMRFKACRHGDTQLRLVEYTPEMEPHWCEKGHIGSSFPRGANTATWERPCRPS